MLGVRLRVLDVQPKIQVVVATQSRGQLTGVGEVAVVPERDRTGRGGAEGGLGVRPDAGTGRRVPAVPDRDMTAQRRQGRLVERLTDQTHVLVDQNLGPVADCDASRLLPPVLQSVEPEIGEFGNLFPRSPDPEDATSVLRS